MPARSQRVLHYVAHTAHGANQLGLETVVYFGGTGGTDGTPPPPENLNLFISKHKRANGFDVEEPTLEGSVYPSSVLDDEIEDAAEVGSEVRGVLWAVSVIVAKLAIFGVDLLAYDEGTVALLVCIAEELSFVVESFSVAGALLFSSRASREL